MIVLIFHPYYQNSFEFEQLPNEKVEGRDLIRVHFQHVKGTRSPSALQLRNRNYPLDWKGTAWIDPETWVVSRIEAELMASSVEVTPMLVGGLRVDLRHLRQPVGIRRCRETHRPVTDVAA